MYDSMKTQNHLKFIGRFMFTSFLKNIGASENVASNFLRQEFSHSNINSTDFDKHYK
jgi:DNA primase large subunit